MTRADKPDDGVARPEIDGNGLARRLARHHTLQLTDAGSALRDRYVHGGWVAAAFDELFGLVQTLGRRPGMTARLTVRCRRPHPLHVPIRLEGWVTRVDGRNIHVAGRSYRADTDQLLADAEALFISVDVSRLLPTAPVTSNTAVATTA